jgi:hypothetical protein
MKVNGQIVMKRNILLVVNYSVFLALFLTGISTINFESLIFIDFVNVVGAVIFLVLIVKSFIEPYLILTGDEIKINREYFKQDKLNIRDIDHLEVNETPFSSSYFLLKNGNKIKINSFALRKEDKQFLEHKFPAGESF